MRLSPFPFKVYYFNTKHNYGTVKNSRNTDVDTWRSNHTPSSAAIDLAELVDRETEHSTQEEFESQSFVRNINPKVLFRLIYETQNLSSLSDLPHYLVHELLLSQESVSTVIESILPNYEDDCDDNIFCAIILSITYFALNHADLSLLRLIALLECSECSQKISKISFTSTTKK